MSESKKIDSGGQGQIYAVNDTTVYKTIKFSDHYKEISELAVLNALPHPCIVKMKRWELTRNECKIYMERMHSNIYDFSKRCTFEKRLELFPNIFWSMVRVARYFQLNGIINCDIKSENVMLSKDGKTVKIIDFGHLICDENYPIIGTRSYQPPELWLEDSYSSKSMVWSIGITCLEFLYRIHPIVDIVYGEESETEMSSPKSHSLSISDSGSGVSDSSEDDFRDRYTNLFEILQEEGASLPFRHRLDVQTNKAVKERLSSINAVLERMLTYDVKKRISLEELYKHRIFERVRGNIIDEAVVTVSREPLLMEKDLTLTFLTLSRKLYRDEIVIQAYTLLSTYLEKNRGPMKDKMEFMVTSLACLDIMSYVFSMVPSSRGTYRKIILKMRGITEYMIFDRVIEILRAVQFKVFLNTPVEKIKSQDPMIVYPLLLELIEADAESNKKRLTSSSLVQRYMSDDFSSDKEFFSDSEEEKDESHETSEHKSEPRTIVVEDESDEEYDEDFLESFKARVQQAYQQEKLRRMQENEPKDVLIIQL